MIAARVAKSLPCLRSSVARRTVVPRAAAPESPDQTPEVTEAVDLTVNPITGNPQTGKLIDVYFEVGSFLVVVAVAFASMWNVKDVLNQTSSADSLREPASKAEWVAMDNQNVYGPCGGAQGSAAAMEDLLEGKPCVPAEYSRAAPKGVM
eukprot:jgi/Ulvmu1/11898/UM081_0057.1